MRTMDEAISEISQCLSHNDQGEYDLVRSDDDPPKQVMEEAILNIADALINGEYPQMDDAISRTCEKILVAIDEMLKRLSQGGDVPKKINVYQLAAIDIMEKYCESP